MSKWTWMIALTGLVGLMAGCGTSGVDIAPTESMPVTVQSSDNVQRIAPAQAKALLDEGEAVLYDTRSAAAYEEQHAAGAISLPEEKVKARFDELPTDRALIFYCT